MSKTRFTPWIVLACVTGLAACTSGGGGTAGNTEMNVIVPNGAPSLGGGSSAPGLIDITTVEYTINCLGNSDTFLDNNASFPDEVQINGNLEVVDGRTSPQGPIPPEFGTPRPGDGAEIWQGFMDLPPGPCTVQLRARDGDGEVICTATEPFTITADSITKVNLVLICDISFQAPVGMLDVDGTFSFNVGNFCPDLFVLNCVDSEPAEADYGIGIPIAATSCEVRFRDGDSTCGAGCDPQSCTVTPEGLTCVPGPDPGVSTTITCVGGQVDCDGNPLSTETSCTFSGDTTGVVGGGPTAQPGTWFAGCIPPALGGTPGAIVTCTAVTTDGDLDCDKTKVVSITCPGLSPCANFGAANGQTANQAGGNAACEAAAGTVCTTDVCNNTGCDGATAAACCTNTPVADGTNCSAELPPLASCQGGVCLSESCTSDADCEDPATECLVAPPGACNLGTGLCGPEVPVADGTSCNGGAGTCQSGTCADNCAGVDCSDGNECTNDVCTSVGGPTCSNPNSATGTPCNGGLGSCDGAGACVTLIDYPNQSAALTVGCRNNVTADISILPFSLDVNPGPMAAGSAFTAVLDGVAAFSEAFLDAAQAVVPGGVKTGQLIVSNGGGLAATVIATGAVTGANVQLGPDPASLSSRCALTGVPCTGAPGLGSCTSIPVVNNNCTTGFVDIPILFGIDTAPGGCTPATPGVPPAACDCSPCAALDTAPDTTKASECAANGFCVTGDLPLPLNATNGSYTAGATSGQPMYFDWLQPYGLDVDGTILLPAAVFSTNPAPVGVRVSAGGLFVALQCAGAVDSGGPDGVGVLDDASPTPNSLKNTFLVP